MAEFIKVSKEMKKNKNTKKIIKDIKKESVFKALSELLSEQGYNVRRERLKTGPGWRVLSGECQYDENKVIFVDSVLEQDQQIEFLAEKIKEMGINVPAELKASLPGYLQ